MNINATELFGVIKSSIEGGTKATREMPGDSERFGGILGDAIRQMNSLEENAATAQSNFQEGTGGTEVHDVMISMQKASLNFQTIVQARNKMVQAYQQISQMNI